MVVWNSKTLDLVVGIYRTSKTPSEALRRVRQALGSEVTYSAIRRALLRHGRPGIQAILGSDVPKTKPLSGVELADKFGFKPHSPQFSFPLPKIPDFAAFDSLFDEDDESKPLKKVLLIPDTHRPFHSVSSWRLMMKAAEKFKPDIVVILGDFVDCFAVSSYARNPNALADLGVEIEDANLGLDDLDSLGATEKFYIEGNHEFRLERYLSEKAPELFNMVSIRDLLKLDKRGWKFTKYRDYLKLGEVYFTHDLGNAGEMAHTKAWRLVNGNIVIGHTHRGAVQYAGNAMGKTNVAMMCGWLGDRDQIDYAHKMQSNSWQTGFGIGYLETDTGFMHLQFCPIFEDRVVIEGELIK